MQLVVYEHVKNVSEIRFLTPIALNVLNVRMVKFVLRIPICQLLNVYRVAPAKKRKTAFAFLVAKTILLLTKCALNVKEIRMQQVTVLCVFNVQIHR